MNLMINKKLTDYNETILDSPGGPVPHFWHTLR